MNNEVWLCMPVVNEEICLRNIPQWKAKGYKIALLQDRVRFDVPDADLIVRPWENYAGYAASANFLVKHCTPIDCGLYVFAGEDMLPDPNHTALQVSDIYFTRFPEGTGVMQPTGDDLTGTDKICGSPFVGSRFARTWNHGLGTFWPGYNHYFADEELHTVTKEHDLLWNNPQLTHYHDHWTRPHNERPEHHAPLQAQWDHDKALFCFRSSKGFPGHSSLDEVQPIIL